MAETPVKKVRKPKKQKVKQGHKLVWLTLVIILIPILILGYELFSSMEGSGKPVVGSRFSSTDLNPSISQGAISSIQSELMNIEGVESATDDLKSATLRIHLNMRDDMNVDQLTAAAEQAYTIVNNYLPIDTYFTNTADSKNYDLEIDAYTYLVDDSHPADGQQFVKIVKNAAGTKTIDVISQPRNPDLSNAVQFTPPAQDEQQDAEQPVDQPAEDEPVYDEGVE